MRRSLCLLAMCLAACSTATTPTGQPATLADVGPRPNSPDQLFARYLEAALKDPQSAQVRRLSGPTPWVKQGTWGSSVAAYGWGVCYAVNAKNSFGGYTGARVYVAVIRNEALVRIIGPSGTNTMQEDGVISSFCRSAAQG